MTPAPEDLENTARDSLDVASQHEANSDDRAELTCLESAAKSLLGAAVARFDDRRSGVDYLRSHDVGAVVRRIARLNDKLYQELIRNDGPPTTAVDNRITPVHIGWLLHEWDAAQTLLSICTDERVARFFPVGKFWAEYHRAMRCLAEGQPYRPAVPKLRGYQKFFLPYLNLIADLTGDRNPEQSRQEIAEHFAKRNRDKRLTDWDLIDGDGRHPVRWDFRETSILDYWELAPRAAG